MEYDVFISYSRADGSEDADAVKRLFERHDVHAYMDSATPPRPGSDLPKEIESRIIASRAFVPVLTNHYIESPWTRREYEIAVSHHKSIVPVVLGSKTAIPWLVSGEEPPWFDRDRMMVFISHGGRNGSTAEWDLIQSTAPASAIIAEANVVAAKSTLAAIDTLNQHIATHGLRGLQSSHLMAYKAYLLRLAGRRSEARRTVEQIRLSPDHPLPIVHMVLVTSAMLRIDMRDYEDARARLAEAAAILSRQSAWKSDDLQRRRFLAEVTRETARSILDEAYDAARESLVNCFALELAWSMYLEAMALVTENEDNLGHAWVHENLGSLAALYASYSATLPTTTAEPQFRGIDYLAISRYRGNPKALLERSLHHFEEAERLFEREREPVVRREGVAWTRYHKIQAELAKHDRAPDACRAAIENLLEVARLFDDITEGKGMTYSQLFFLAHELGDDRAAEFGRQAVTLLQASEKHEEVVAKVRAKANHLGGAAW